MSAPSTLPSGDELAQLAWRLVANRALEVLPRIASSDVERRIATTPNGLRLEQLMAVMSRDVPLRVLAEVYAVMEDALSNDVHRALVSMGRVDHVTLNMDSLLEQAAGEAGAIVSLVHLHGLHSDPSSIVTTIEQYLDGLPDPLSGIVADGLEGRDVLVVGYSGRDRDVLPMFVRHPPARLTWVVHPGRGEAAEMDRDHDANLAPEVREMLDRLRERVGRANVRTPRATTTDAIEVLHFGRPRPDREVEADPTEATEWPLPAGAVAAMSQINPSAALMAVGAVMLEVGMSAEALEPLRRARPAGSDARIRRRKQIGRALAKTGHPRRALWSFLRPILRVSPVRQGLTMVTEVANVAAAAGLPARAIWLDQTLVDAAEPLRRAALLARSRRGQRMNLQGLYQEALDEFDRIIDAEHSDRFAGLSQVVDALTWSADVEKIRGNYTAALDRIRRAELEVPYSNLSQRAWVVWKRAEIRMLADIETDRSEEELRDAVSLATASGDRAAQFWATVTLAAAQGTDPELAMHTLHHAQTLHPHPRPDAQVYFLLQRAETLRTSAALDAAIEDLARARRIVADRRRLPTGYASATLVIDLIDAKIAVMREGRTAADCLAAVAAGFDAAGMPAAASHTHVCYANAIGTTISNDELRSWSQRGWHLEAELGRHPTPVNQPWRMIL